MTIRVNRFDISFSSSNFASYILTVYSTGCYDKCFKTGNTERFSKTQIYGAPY